MSETVRVPLEKMAALREAAKKATPGPWQVSYLDEGIAEIETVDGVHIAVADGRPADAEFIVAARAVVDAVETEDEIRLNPGVMEQIKNTSPSPASDDAEKAIARLILQHQPCIPITSWDSAECERCRTVGQYSSDEDDAAHLASVIAAHMTDAPDELTALRKEIRALADEYTPTDERRNWPSHLSNRIRATLGDA